MSTTLGATFGEDLEVVSMNSCTGMLNANNYLGFPSDAHARPDWAVFSSFSL